MKYPEIMQHEASKKLLDPNQIRGSLNIQTSIGTKMEEFEKEKAKFIYQLRLTDKWKYGNILEFFDEIFDYLRLRKALNICYFTDDETKALTDCLNKLIGIILNDLNHYLIRLKPEETYHILQIRSVLQFFLTDFMNFTNETSKEKLRQMIAYDSELWTKVDEASSNDGLLSWYRGKIPNIQGIPESHFWWTEYHRKGEDNPVGFDFEEFVAKLYPNYKTL